MVSDDGLLDIEVAENVIAVVADGVEPGRSNATVVIRGGGATVIDTLLLPRLAMHVHRVTRAHRAQAGLVLNTHPHVDHVGGNPAFPEATILAPRATSESVRRMAADTSFLPRLFPTFAGELAALELRVPDAMDEPCPIPDGKVLWYGPAHTPVDLAVWLPGPSVVAAGDLCANGVVPLALPGHARLDGWVAALDALIELRPTTVVPGHGRPGGPEVLTATRRYLATVLEVATIANRDGRDPLAVAATTDWTAVAGWALQERTATNVMVAWAEVTGDTSRLPHGIPVASRDH